MMGRQTVDQSQLFYLFNLEERIPARHLLRGINPVVTQVLSDLRHHRIDPAQQMACRNAFFEVEQVKQLALIDRLPTHHGKSPPPVASSRRNHCSPFIASPFSTVSTQLRHRLAIYVAVAKPVPPPIKILV